MSLSTPTKDSVEVPLVFVEIDGKEVGVNLFEIKMNGKLWPSPSEVLKLDDPTNVAVMFMRGPLSEEDMNILELELFEQLDMVSLFVLENEHNGMIKDVFFTYATIKKELGHKATIFLDVKFITDCPLPSKFVDCCHCGQPICHVVQYKDSFNSIYRARVKELEWRNLPLDEFRKSIRFALYKEYTSLEFGILGRGNRREPPVCVVDFVRNAAADPNNAYTGYIE